MMMKKTIMNKILKYPIAIRSIHRYEDLPKGIKTWHTDKESLTVALFDLSLDWGITELFVGKTQTTIWLQHCVDWKGELHDTNIDADTIEHITEGTLQ